MGVAEGGAEGTGGAGVGEVWVVRATGRHRIPGVQQQGDEIERIG